MKQENIRIIFLIVIIFLICISYFYYNQENYDNDLCNVGIYPGTGFIAKGNCDKNKPYCVDSYGRIKSNNPKINKINNDIIYFCSN